MFTYNKMLIISQIFVKVPGGFPTLGLETLVIASGSDLNHLTVR
jgi:hypothetical protein